MLKRIIRIIIFFYLLEISCNVSGTLAQDQISGISGELLNNVRISLNKNQSINPETTIQSALEPFGYFHPKIETRFIKTDRGKITLYQINPGPPTRITQLKLDYSGSDATVFNVIQHFQIRIGQAFSSQTYEDAKQNVLEELHALGYLTAHWQQHQVVIDRRNNTARINLQLESGTRFHFGPIIWQQTIFNSKFLQRYLPFKSTDFYSAQALTKLQTDLINSQYFKNVTIDSFSLKDRDVPVRVNLIEKPPQQYTAGLGYSTDVGARINLGWNVRYLNAWGHRLSLQTQLSHVQSSAQLTYNIPGNHPAHDQYYINAALSKQQLSQVNSVTTSIGVSSTKRDAANQYNLFLNYQNEFYQYLNQPTQKAHVLLPGINWARNQFDDLLFPKNGYAFSIKIQGAAQPFLSSTSFLQGEFKNKYILSTQQQRLILSGDFGATSIKNLQALPASLLFYAGGNQSVRGYGYQTLGPGRYLFTTQAELQQHLIDKFYGAAFFDAGDAAVTLPFHLKKSVGIGLVWISPLGEMELSLAKALNLPGQPLRIGFSMGTDLL
jgi:translocation and assembly module TamA